MTTALDMILIVLAMSSLSASNTLAQPSYLSAIISEMADDNVGLVSSLLVGVGEDSLGAQCENLHLNTFVAGGVCLAAVTEKPCVLGKSMLLRRHELTTLGGFEALRDVLAEDYVLGQRYHAAGYRVVLSCSGVATYNRQLPMRRFVARHLRWAQLRRSCAIGPFASELLLYATPWLAAPLLASQRSGIWALCSLALLLHVASDALLAKTVSGRWPPLLALCLLPLKDCVLLAVWIVAMLRRSVDWRGHSLRIGPGSQLMPAQDRMGLRGRIGAVFQ